MKKNTENKMRLGIFVTVGVALLIAGIYFIGERQQLFGSTFRVSAIFKDINGLQIGNNVLFSGINVGIINDIQQITDSTVKVEMMIKEDARKFMKKNAKAIIGSDGLMGNKLILIIPGVAGKQQLADNDFIATTRAVSVDDILIKLKVTSDNAANITGDLAIITNNIKEGRGTIGKLFMDSTMANNVNDAMVNIKQGAGGFKQNMNASSHNFYFRGSYTHKAKVEKEKVEEKEKKTAEKAEKNKN